MHTQRTLVELPINSGISRCEWNRFIEANVKIMKTKVNKGTNPIGSPQSLRTNEITNSIVHSTRSQNDAQISPKPTRPKTKPKAKSTHKRKRLARQLGVVHENC